MGLGEHRNVFPLIGIALKLGDEFFNLGIEDFLKGLLDREGDTGVVDILRSKTEMDELLVRLEISCRNVPCRRESVELLLDIVFHCLDIMICDALYILDALRTGNCECLVDAAKHGEETLVEGRELGQRQLAERDEIFYFDTDAITDEGILGKILGKWLGFAPVASVDRRDGGQ